MASWHPKDASDQQAVREQLERLLRDPLFAHSKRYPALLRYVVEKSLCGEDADLKERTIGVEAFGRTPNYDTNADTIVRVAAGEIRRRLAQYYYCAGHEEELRIELNSGSYVPEFYPADGSVQSPAAPTISPQLLEAPAKEAAKADVSEAPLIDNSIASQTRSQSSKERLFNPSRIWAAIAAIALCSLLAIYGWNLHFHADERNFAEFWEPIVASQKDPLLCIGDRASFNMQRIAIGESAVLAQASGSSLQTLDQLMQKEAVYSFSQVNYVTRIDSTLQLMHKKPIMVSASKATLTDMRENPAVLTGFNNLWTVKVLSGLRYSFRMEKAGGVIFDSQNPTQLTLSLPLNLPLAKLSKDYGLIARLQNTSFDQPVIVMAGLGDSGQIASIELGSNPEYIADVLRKAPRNWAKMNVEAIFSTEVVDGISGRPHIEAVYWW